VYSYAITYRYRIRKAATVQAAFKSVTTLMSRFKPNSKKKMANQETGEYLLQEDYVEMTDVA